MNRLFITILFLSFSIRIYSQEIKFFNQRPVKNLSFGLGGDGGLISLNYEKLHLISFKLMLTHEIGVGASQDYSFLNPNNYYLSFPLNISACLGRRKHLFEMGLGSTIYLMLNNNFYSICIYPIIGYRIQPLKDGKIMFKLFATVPYNLNFDTYINLKDSDILYLPFGISIGKSF